MTNREVILREVTDSDLEAFFEHQEDPRAVYMAAFTSEDPADRAAFDAHWKRIRANPAIFIRTIDVDGQAAGHIAAFEREGEAEVTYWLGREYWGKGIATQVLQMFLEFERRRPIYGRAAKDNRASIRVLEKCGFRLVGEERGFANARQQEIDEVILVLE